MKQKTVRWIIPTVASIFLCSTLVFSFIYSYRHSPKYCSRSWKSISPGNIKNIILLPAMYKDYTKCETISKAIEINNKSTIKSIVSVLDGKHEIWEYTNKWGSRKELNIKFITTSNKIFIFRLSFFVDDSFVRYSEIYPNTYSKSADFQKTYGDFKASKDLSSIMKKCIKGKDIYWIPADKL